MPSLRDIRRRIRSIKGTQQITRAMKMVAAVKFRRAQERILAARPYARKMLQVLQALASHSQRELHPLLAKRGDRRIELVVLTSDRGLCGSFNANILRYAVDFVRVKQRHGVEVTLHVVGRKGLEFFKRRPYSVRRTWTGLSGKRKKMTYEGAARIAEDITRNFVEERTFDEVYLLYNEFKSAAVQRVTAEKLLPIEPGGEAPEEITADYLYEPSPEGVLDSLLPKHIEVQIFHALLESQASEEGARMMAMDTATKNAKEMIAGLTLTFNKARQAAITKELMEVIGGAEALRG